ncbi:MAG: glycosyltransferase family 4 protein [Prevotella sp.]|nr:glycosyltransferase family 4 protein [Prevotella sp.]
MRVLIVNTSEKTGGAAVAANRLMEALNNNGVKAKMLVRDKDSDNITVVGLKKSWFSRWNFLWERWKIYSALHLSRKHLFDIDTASMGTDITTMREFKEADIIHLHWINQGMLSLTGIRKILNSGKPVVWTMHDAWPATGICHYTRGCQAFTTICGNCPFLPGEGSKKDLANRVWHRKNQLFQGNNISFVACSKWLEGLSRKSALLRGQEITNIPNTIDTHVFCRKDKQEARTRVGLPTDKRIILFVSQRVTDRRKGMDFMIEAIDRLVAERPEMKENTVIAIMGGHSENFDNHLALPVYALGYIHEEKKVADVYNSADVFVLPSLEDNLPNTIMEALACGVPSVGFKVGGIPEEIDHEKNGYVAKYRDSLDLAHGIYWCLCEADYQMLSDNAIKKVTTAYSQRNVALKYIEVYNQALATKNYNI